MKVISPFHKIVPYKEHHVELVGRFDWLDALRMLRKSAQMRSSCDTFVITDDADFPLPHYRYRTEETYLMLWVLEVCLRYMESEDFDQDTVFVSPDSLVMGNLDIFGGFDIAVSARPSKLSNRLMNGLQWWPLASRDKLLAMQRRALDIARGLPENDKLWGADTIPLLELLGPIEEGLHQNGELVVRVFPHPTLQTVNAVTMRKLEAGRRINPHNSLVHDFKYWNKVYMVPYFQKVFEQ